MATEMDMDMKTSTTEKISPEVWRGLFVKHSGDLKLMEKLQIKIPNTAKRRYSEFFIM